MLKNMVLFRSRYLKIISALFILISIKVSPSDSYGKLQRIIIREINLNKSPANKSLWSNEGYQESNTAQISRRLNGVKLNVSAHFLMGTNVAKLHTTLSAFSGKFLFIKFSSMIGKSIVGTKPTTTTSTTSTTTTTTTTTTPPTTTKLSTTTTTTLAPTTTTTTTTTAAPTTLEPIVPPTISDTSNLEGPTKLQPGQIIEIALDNNDQRSIQINPDPMESIKSRKKRELNSQEISQVHKIISEAANKKEDTKPIVTSNKPNSSLMEKAVLDANLQYKTWKASLSQSFRPSGFYVIVDDHVVYDNWEGVWDLQKPNVLGKHVKNSASDIWSHTEILIEWDEPPQKDVKIRFEWDPPTPSSFLFLGDITVSTIAAEKMPNPQLPYASETLNNKNITLYIVVKQPEVVKVMTAGPEVKHFELPVTTPTTATTSKATTTTSITDTAVTTITAKNVLNTTRKPIILQRVGITASNSGKANHNKSNKSVPFIVATVIGVICIFILIVLMHSKFKENQRLRGSYC